METKVVLLKCSPGARFHFGKVGLDDNTALNDTETHIPSDTLFSAIINLAEVIGDKSEVDSLIQNFRDGIFKVSSGYFCLTDADSRIIFLPKPVHYNQYLPKENAKKYRQIRYISTEVWNTGALPRTWHQDDFVILQNIFLVTRKELSASMLSAPESIEIFKEQLFPRVSARIPGAENSHYYVSNICIPDNTDKTDEDGQLLFPNLEVHFYFLLGLKHQNTPGYALLKTILDLLPDNGVGGERSSGCGIFSGMDIFDFPPIRAEKNDQCYASISLCSPKDDEDLKCFESYDTGFRGGRKTASDGQLRYVRMILEGGLQLNKEAQGSIVDISPTNNGSYLRYGIPFNLPVVF